MMDKKTIASLVIAALMVLSIFGAVSDQIGSSSNKVKYNGYKFVQTPQGWLVKVNGRELLFNFFPSELESVELSSGIIEILKSAKSMFITYNTESSDPSILAKLQFLLEKELPFFNEELYITRGLTKTQGSALPEISCSNATQFIPVIFLNTTEIGSIHEENNCIIIDGNSESVFMSIEKIIYVLAGIMK